MNRAMILMITMLATTACGTTASAWSQGPVLLGERNVSDAAERDTIRVGGDFGAFTGLRVRVSGAPVEFKRVVVHFENGGEQVFERNLLVGRGDRTRVIDLRGGARLIEKVVFYYEARSRGWKGAHMKLFGVR